MRFFRASILFPTILAANACDVDSSAIATTICEIRANESSFVGKRVSVTALIESDGEHTAFVDSSCPNRGAGFGTSATSPAQVGYREVMGEAIRDNLFLMEPDLPISARVTATFIIDDDGQRILNEIRFHSLQIGKGNHYTKH